MRNLTLQQAPISSSPDGRRRSRLDRRHGWILGLMAVACCIGAIDINPLIIPFSTCALAVFVVVVRRDLSVQERIFRYFFFPPYLLSLSISLSLPGPSPLAGSIAISGLVVAISWADDDRRALLAAGGIRP